MGGGRDCKGDTGRDDLGACPSVKNETGIAGHATIWRGGRDGLSRSLPVLVF